MTRAPVIDADAHILERDQDIRKYLEPPWDHRDRPLLPGGYPWDNTLFGRYDFPGYPSGLSPEEQVSVWLEIMERENIEKAVVFPTRCGSVVKLREPAFATAVARAANTHFSQEYAARCERLRPVGVLPLQEPQTAAIELNRAVTELGLVSFELLTQGLRLGLGDPFYDPIYEEAQRLGVPLCIHGTRFNAEEVGGELLKTFNETHCYAFPASMFLHFTSMIFNGVPVRFPRLKLAFLEIGVTWLPYYLDRMDEHWELRGDFEAPLLKEKPSQLVRQWPICFSVEAEESLLPQTIDYLGEDHFVFASDIPHWDARFPSNLQTLESRTDIPESAKRKMLYDNAKALFGL